MAKGRSVVLQWLSIVYARQERLHLRLPDIPAIGRTLTDSSVFDWTDECSCEARELGEAARYTFDAYLRFLENPLYLPGSTSAHPIVLEESDADVVSAGGGEAMEVCVAEASAPLVNGVLGAACTEKCSAMAPPPAMEAVPEGDAVTSSSPTVRVEMVFVSPSASDDDYDRPVGASSPIVVYSSRPSSVAAPPVSSAECTMPIQTSVKGLTMAQLLQYAAEVDESMEDASTSSESDYGHLRSFYSTSASSLDSAFYSFTTRETAS
ncbi:hypothetical protein KC19_10G015200, partial [Ceratodon purpureus]